jgi:hypothetical protein
MTCPKCGSELEIMVEMDAIHVLLLRTKKERKAEMTI